MPIELKGKSLLTLEEFTYDEVHHLLDSARNLKHLKTLRVFPRNLANRNIALIFLKPSARTQTSFVVAAADEGAHLEIFSPESIRFGIKESVRDIARVFGALFDGVAFRGFDHGTAEELTAHAGVPVWNGLTDDHHPTQVLADLMTILEEFDRLDGIIVGYVGDGRNNMANSLKIGALKMGLDLRIVAPRVLQPVSSIQSDLADLSHEPRITITGDIAEGLRNCDVVYGDAWISMGEEHLVGERVSALREFRITQRLMEMTGKQHSIFLHCLPSLHNHDTEFATLHPQALDVDDDVFEGPQSRVFTQAENRMHTIKALMVATI